jgi:hypothetical protein
MILLQFQIYVWVLLMPRGGKREGSGLKPTWNAGKTKVIRVPEALADRIMEFAKILDSGVSLNDVTQPDNDSVTISKVINLSGVTIRAFSNGSGVYLSDLVRAGYSLKPDSIAKLVERKSRPDLAVPLKEQIDREIAKISNDFGI